MRTPPTLKVQKRLLTIALLTALGSISPALAQQAAPEPEPVRAASAAEAERAAERLAAESARVADLIAAEKRASNEMEAARAERYIEALQMAETEQRAALEAVAAARAELSQQAEIQRELAHKEHEESRAHAEQQRSVQSQIQKELSTQQRVETMELREVQRELEKAHANLRRASQEVARVHGKLRLPNHSRAPRVGFFESPAVIGVVLGNNTPEGVKLLAVSPDGPAERAGLQQGDVIISLMGESLSDDEVNGRSVLSAAMEAVEPGDELLVVYQRGDEQFEEVLIAEERTPFSWHSVTRLVSAPNIFPDSPDSDLEGILIGQSMGELEFDMQELERNLEAVREEFDERRIIIERFGPGDAPLVDGQSSLFGVEHLSDAGDAALASTNIWFGVPLTRGLKLAELDSELGIYFEASQGVLVLSAQADNELQLKSGDVIISVAGTEVQRPGDVMRALRNVNTGDMINLVIKRQGEEQIIDLQIPENRLGLLFDGRFPGAEGQSWDFHFEPVFPDKGTK